MLISLGTLKDLQIYYLVWTQIALSVRFSVTALQRVWRRGAMLQMH